MSVRPSVRHIYMTKVIVHRNSYYSTH